MRVAGITKPSSFVAASAKLSEFNRRKREDKERGIGSSKPNDDDSDWESASDDEDSSSEGANSELAYGGTVSNALRPTVAAATGVAAGAAIASAASKWTSQAKPSPERRNTVVDPNLFGPVNSLRGMVNTPCGFADGKATPISYGPNGPEPLRTDSASQAPMRTVYAVPTSDPGRFDAERSSITSSRQELPYHGRPAPVPIQQPIPKIPVSSKIYEAEKLDDATRRDSLASYQRPDERSWAGAATAAVAAAAVGAALARGPLKERHEYRKDERREREKRPENIVLQDRESKRRDWHGEVDREYPRTQRESYTAKYADEADHKRSSRHNDYDTSSRKRREVGDDKHPESVSYTRGGEEIRVEYEPESRNEAPRFANRDSQGRDSRDTRLEYPLAEKAGSQKPVMSDKPAEKAPIDPFQFQVPDDAFQTPQNATPMRPLTPQIVTVAREPNFDDSPPRSAVSTGRLSRRDSFEIENRSADPSKGHEYEEDEHAARSIYDEARHATVPISAAAVASAIAIERARSEERRRSGLSEDGSRDRSRPDKDTVQAEADRRYRESVIARKIAGEEIRNHNHEEERSVVGKWADDDTPEKFTIVTPPDMEDRRHDKGPYDAPNADVRIDNKIFPREAHRFLIKADDLDTPRFKSRDPSCERERPLLNLVLPTPIPSRSASPAVPQRQSEEASRNSEPSAPSGGVDVVVARDEPAPAAQAKSVTWGENETKSFEVDTPDNRSDHEGSRSWTDAGDRPRPRLNKSSQWGIIAAAIAGSSTEPANEPDVASAHDNAKGLEDGYKSIDLGRDRTVLDDSVEAPPVPGPKPNSPIQDQMPGGFADDIEFAATLAAGLKDTGFDPNIVIEDPQYHRRQSPPGSNELNGQGLYRGPWAETVSDIGLHEAHTNKDVPEPGFVVGEVETPTADTVVEAPSSQSSWVDVPANLSKRERKRLEKLANGRSPEAESPAVESPDTPAWEDAPETISNLSKKERRRRDKESKSEVVVVQGDESPSSGEPDSGTVAREAGEEIWEESSRSKSRKHRKSRDTTGAESPKIIVPVDTYDDIQSPRSGKAEDEWDTPRKSKKKSRHESTDSPSRSVAASEASVDSSGKRSSKHKRRSSTKDDFSENSRDSPSRRRDPFEDREVSSVVSEPRHDDRRKESRKGKSSSSRYEDDDTKSVASAPGSSRRGKEPEKRSSGLFSSIFKSNGYKEDGKRDSFLDNAGTLGAGAGLAGAVVAIASSLTRSNAAETSEEKEAAAPNLEDIEIVPRVIKPAIDPQYGDLLPLPPSEPGSPSNVPEELPDLPDSRPDTPPEERSLLRGRISHQRRRSAQETPAKSPSHTAIPISLRLGQRGAPSSPAGFKSSPVTTPTIPSHEPSSASRRPGRPMSWEGTKEIRPLYLLESSRQSATESATKDWELPALPPSEASSRESPSPEDQAAIHHEMEGVRDLSALDMVNSALRIDTSVPSFERVADIAGSQETTPKADRRPELPLSLSSESTAWDTLGSGQHFAEAQPDEAAFADPDPVDPVSKNRSSYLLHSEPSSVKSTRSTDADQLPQSPPDSTPTKRRLGDLTLSDIPEDLTSADEHFSDAVESRTGDDAFEDAAAEWSIESPAFDQTSTSPTLSNPVVEQVLDQTAILPLTEKSVPEEPATEESAVEEQPALSAKDRKKAKKAARKNKAAEAPTDVAPNDAASIDVTPDAVAPTEVVETAAEPQPAAQDPVPKLSEADTLVEETVIEEPPTPKSGKRNKKKKKNAMSWEAEVDQPAAAPAVDEAISQEPSNQASDDPPLPAETLDKGLDEPTSLAEATDIKADAEDISKPAETSEAAATDPVLEPSQPAENPGIIATPEAPAEPIIEVQPEEPADEAAFEALGKKSKKKKKKGKSTDTVVADVSEPVVTDAPEPTVTPIDAQEDQALTDTTETSPKLDNMAESDNIPSVVAANAVPENNAVAEPVSTVEIQEDAAIAEPDTPAEVIEDDSTVVPSTSSKKDKKKKKKRGSQSEDPVATKEDAEPVLPTQDLPAIPVEQPDATSEDVTSSEIPVATLETVTSDEVPPQDKALTEAEPGVAPVPKGKKKKNKRKSVQWEAESEKKDEAALEEIAAEQGATISDVPNNDNELSNPIASASPTNESVQEPTRDLPQASEETTADASTDQGFLSSATPLIPAVTGITSVSSVFKNVGGGDQAEKGTDAAKVAEDSSDRTTPHDGVESKDANDLEVKETTDSKAEAPAPLEEPTTETTAIPGAENLLPTDDTSLPIDASLAVDTGLPDDASPPNDATVSKEDEPQARIADAGTEDNAPDAAPDAAEAVTEPIVTEKKSKKKKKKKNSIAFDEPAEDVVAEPMDKDATASTETPETVNITDPTPEVDLTVDRPTSEASESLPLQKPIDNEAEAVETTAEDVTPTPGQEAQPEDEWGLPSSNKKKKKKKSKAGVADSNDATDASAAVTDKASLMTDSIALTQEPEQIPESVSELPSEQISEQILEQNIEPVEQLTEPIPEPTSEQISDKPHEEVSGQVEDQVTVMAEEPIDPPETPVEEEPQAPGKKGKKKKRQSLPSTPVEELDTFVTPPAEPTPEPELAAAAAPEAEAETDTTKKGKKNKKKKKGSLALDAAESQQQADAGSVPDIAPETSARDQAEGVPSLPVLGEPAKDISAGAPAVGEVGSVTATSLEHTGEDSAPPREEGPVDAGLQDEAAQSEETPLPASEFATALEFTQDTGAEPSYFPSQPDATAAVDAPNPDAASELSTSAIPPTEDAETLFPVKLSKKDKKKKKKQAAMDLPTAAEAETGAVTEDKSTEANIAEETDLASSTPLDGQVADPVAKPETPSEETQTAQTATTDQPLPTNQEPEANPEDEWGGFALKKSKKDKKKKKAKDIEFEIPQDSKPSAPTSPKPKAEEKSNEPAPEALLTNTGLEPDGVGDISLGSGTKEQIEPVFKSEPEAEPAPESVKLDDDWSGHLPKNEDKMPSEEGSLAPEPVVEVGPVQDAVDKLDHNELPDQKAEDDAQSSGPAKKNKKKKKNKGKAQDTEPEERSEPSTIPVLAADESIQVSSPYNDTATLLAAGEAPSGERALAEQPRESQESQDIPVLSAAEEADTATEVQDTLHVEDAERVDQSVEQEPRPAPGPDEGREQLSSLDLAEGVVHLENLSDPQPGVSTTDTLTEPNVTAAADLPVPPTEDIVSSVVSKKDKGKKKKKKGRIEVPELESVDDPSADHQQTDVKPDAELVAAAALTQTEEQPKSLDDSTTNAIPAAVLSEDEAKLEHDEPSTDANLPESALEAAIPAVADAIHEADTIPESLPLDEPLPEDVSEAQAESLESNSAGVVELSKKDRKKKKKKGKNLEQETEQGASATMDQPTVQEAKSELEPTAEIAPDHAPESVAEAKINTETEAESGPSKTSDAVPVTAPVAADCIEHKIEETSETVPKTQTEVQADIQDQQQEGDAIDDKALSSKDKKKKKKKGKKNTPDQDDTEPAVPSQATTQSVIPEPIMTTATADGPQENLQAEPSEPPLDVNILEPADVPSPHAVPDTVDDAAPSTSLDREIIQPADEGVAASEDVTELVQTLPEVPVEEPVVAQADPEASIQLTTTQQMTDLPRSDVPDPTIPSVADTDDPSDMLLTGKKVKKSKKNKKSQAKAVTWETDAETSGLKTTEQTQPIESAPILGAADAVASLPDIETSTLVEDPVSPAATEVAESQQVSEHLAISSPTDAPQRLEIAPVAGEDADAVETMAPDTAPSAVAEVLEEVAERVEPYIPSSVPLDDTPPADTSIKETDLKEMDVLLEAKPDHPATNDIPKKLSKKDKKKKKKQTAMVEEAAEPVQPNLEDSTSISHTDTIAADLPAPTPTELIAGHSEHQDAIPDAPEAKISKYDVETAVDNAQEVIVNPPNESSQEAIQETVQETTRQILQEPTKEAAEDIAEPVAAEATQEPDELIPKLLSKKDKKKAKKKARSLPVAAEDGVVEDSSASAIPDVQDPTLSREIAEEQPNQQEPETQPIEDLPVGESEALNEPSSEATDPLRKDTSTEVTTEAGAPTEITAVPTSETSTEPTKEPHPEPATKTLPKPTAEALSESITGVVAEPATEARPDPLVEAASESTVEVSTGPITDVSIGGIAEVPAESTGLTVAVPLESTSERPLKLAAETPKDSDKEVFAQEPPAEVIEETQLEPTAELNREDAVETLTDPDARPHSEATEGPSKEVTIGTTAEPSKEGPEEAEPDYSPMSRKKSKKEKKKNAAGAAATNTPTSAIVESRQAQEPQSDKMSNTGEPVQFQEPSADVGAFAENTAGPPQEQPIVEEDNEWAIPVKKKGKKGKKSKANSGVATPRDILETSVPGSVPEQIADEALPKSGVDTADPVPVSEPHIEPTAEFAVSPKDDAVLSLTTEPAANEIAADAHESLSGLQTAVDIQPVIDSAPVPSVEPRDAFDLMPVSQDTVEERIETVDDTALSDALDTEAHTLEIPSTVTAEPAPEPAPQSAPESVSEQALEPTPEQAPEQAPETVPEPIPEPKLESVNEAPIESVKATKEVDVAGEQPTEGISGLVDADAADLWASPAKKKGIRGKKAKEAKIEQQQPSVPEPILQNETSAPTPSSMQQVDEAAAGASASMPAEAPNDNTAEDEWTQPVAGKKNKKERKSEDLAQARPDRSPPVLFEQSLQPSIGDHADELQPEPTTLVAVPNMEESQADLSEVQISERNVPTESRAPGADLQLLASTNPLDDNAFAFEVLDENGKPKKNDWGLLQPVEEAPHVELADGGPDDSVPVTVTKKSKKDKKDKKRKSVLLTPPDMSNSATPTETEHPIAIVEQPVTMDPVAVHDTQKSQLSADPLNDNFATSKSKKKRGKKDQASSSDRPSDVLEVEDAEITPLDSGDGVADEEAKVKAMPEVHEEPTTSKPTELAETIGEKSLNITDEPNQAKQLGTELDTVQVKSVEVSEAPVSAHWAEEMLSSSLAEHEEKEKGTVPDDSVAELITGRKDPEETKSAVAVVDTIEGTSSKGVVDEDSKEQDPVVEAVVAAGVAATGAAAAAAWADKASSGKKAKKGKKKVLDKRRAQEEDIFDDPAVWEGADKKAMEAEDVEQANDEFWGGGEDEPAGETVRDREIQPAATPKSESLTESEGGWKETARQGARLVDDEVDESPILGRGESYLSRNEPLEMLQRGRDIEHGYGHGLTKEDRGQGQQEVVRLDVPYLRRSPSRSLPAVQEIPEAEAEGTRDSWATGDTNRDSGIARESPDPLRRRSDPHGEEAQRDSGVHSGDWTDAIKTPDASADKKSRRGAFGTPVVLEPAARRETPEPEKKRAKSGEMVAGKTKAKDKDYGQVGDRDGRTGTALLPAPALSPAPALLPALGVTAAAAATTSTSDTTPSRRSVSDGSYTAHKQQQQQRGDAAGLGQSPLSMGARRSVSNTSLSRHRTPEPLKFRPDSPGIRPTSTPTPPLRRVDKRMSGDLRALRQQSNSTPVANEGRVRAKDMTDVYVSLFSYLYLPPFASFQRAQSVSLD